MKYIRSLLILSVLSFSLSSMALMKQPAPGKIDPGGVGGSAGGGSIGGANGGAGGGKGGVVGGVSSGDVQVDLQPFEGQVAAIDLGAPQFGINDVKPTSSGGCSVRGITSGAWSGSPCEKIYGPSAPKLQAPNLPVTSPSPSSF